MYDSLTSPIHGDFSFLQIDDNSSFFLIEDDDSSFLSIDDDSSFLLIDDDDSSFLQLMMTLHYS